MKLTDFEIAILQKSFNSDVLSYMKGRLNTKDEQEALVAWHDRLKTIGVRLANKPTPAEIWTALQGTAGKSNK